MSDVIDIPSESSAQAVAVRQLSMSRKAVWARNKARRFSAEFGYSVVANAGCGGRRLEILQRDGFACVRCGMTDAEHRAKWCRPITIDHKDRNRRNNDPSNLQTLCLSCHGSKDVLPRLIAPRCAPYRGSMLEMRRSGFTFQAIAEQTGFSIGAVWKWINRWLAETKPL